MMNFQKVPYILALIVFASFFTLYSDGCGSNNVQCYDDTTYQLCLNASGTVYLVGANLTCSTDQVCSESTNTTGSACVDSTTTAATTTISDIQNCTAVGAGRYETSLCYQYFECVQALWWYGFRSVNCTNGTAFNVTSQDCVNSTTCLQS